MSQTQAENERFMLDNFLSVIGITPENVDRGPVQDGNAKPDFIVTVAGKRIGVEETRYYRAQRPDELQPRQATESAWNGLKYVIKHARDRCGELKGVYGAIRFRDCVLPPSKTYKALANELMEFAKGVLGEFAPDRKRYKAFGETYPLLNAYVDYLELQQVDCCMSWDWRHNADFVGLQEDELLEVLRAKIEKHFPSKVAEDWLLITSRTELSQQMGWLSVAKLNEYADVGDLLKSSPFDKVYIYDYMRSKVVLWTPEGGWVEVSEHGSKDGIP